MQKSFIKILMFIFVVASISGCVATKKYKVKGYIEDRKRVDQSIDGNAGYITGTPSEEDLAPGKPTRKVFVVEVIKPTEENSDAEYLLMEETDTYKSSGSTREFKAPAKKKRSAPVRQRLKLPSFDDEDDYMVEEEPTSVSGNFTEYTVQKNDTLQKISKKFYGGYSKWSKIYEANKDVIDNPDSIKPGVVLRIPE